MFSLARPPSHPNLASVPPPSAPASTGGGLHGEAGDIGTAMSGIGRRSQGGGTSANGLTGQATTASSSRSDLIPDLTGVVVHTSGVHTSDRGLEGRQVGEQHVDGGGIEDGDSTSRGGSSGSLSGMTTPDSVQSSPYAAGDADGSFQRGRGHFGETDEAKEAEASGLGKKRIDGEGPGQLQRTSVDGGVIHEASEAGEEEMKVIPAPEIHTKLVIGRPQPTHSPAPSMGASASDWLSGIFAAAGRRQHQPVSPSRSPAFGAPPAAFSEKAFQEHMERRGRELEADGGGQGGAYMGR